MSHRKAPLYPLPTGSERVGLLKALFGPKAYRSVISALLLAFFQAALALLAFLPFSATPALAGPQTPGPNYNAPIDRPYTLRLPEPFVLEREYARMMESGKPMSFIFPRPCVSEIDSSRVCGDKHGWSYAEPEKNKFLNVSPQAGYEYRYDRENVNAFEGGLLATGATGPVSFYLDARTFTELHEDPNHPSFDREFVERQDEEASGSIAYSSYSRYRGNVALDLGWTRFTAGRDALHWGPALYTNLTFNREAVPFNHVAWTTTIGPVTVVSVYGQLNVEGDREFEKTALSRSLYSRRYEWRPHPDFTFGINEQLLVYSYEEPFAFLPILPLFIYKGTGYERLNNGNIASDLNWRLRPWMRVYTEFFVDDVQSPTSIFNDHWGNKWAWLWGIHLFKNYNNINWGFFVEAARIEPWVYTHYIQNTVQAANLGVPLGNSLGPNAWTAQSTTYAIYNNWYASIKINRGEKGKDLGSEISDTSPQGTSQKDFLSPPTNTSKKINLTAGYRMRSALTEGALSWDGEFKTNIRIFVHFR